MFRQGDVLLVPVKRIASDAKDITPSNGPVILMWGELTHHHHRFEDRDAVKLLETDTGERYIEISKPSALSHEEHDAIMFTGKEYQQVFQVEDFGEEVRRVAD